MSRSERLEQLECEVRQQLERTAYPRPEWLTPKEHRGARVVDVLIIGGGQAGLTVAHALKRRAITNTLILESAPAGKAGPWTTYAAMHTLRTPKTLTGPDQGLPALTPESWYRAAFGDRAWENIDFIAKEHWQEYLNWFRAITQPKIRHEVDVTSIGPAGPVLAVEHSAGTTYARRVVLATGMAGNGEWTVPAAIKAALPADRYVHTGAPVDFSRYAGQRVGVLGGGASAFDYGASALESGARSVDLFYRRSQVPRVNPFRWMEFYAFGAHFPDLPDEDKWKFTVQFQRTNQPPPQQTWYRCTRWDNFDWHTDASWQHVALDGTEIVVDTGAGSFRFDAIISATGPSVDLAARPELQALAPHITRWSDRFTAPPGWEDPALLRYPYLGPGFEFQPRNQSDPDWVSCVHDFTYGARLSMGLNGNMNSGLGAGGRRLADALSRSLFVEDRKMFFDSYQSYDVQELIDLGRQDQRGADHAT